MVRLQAGLSRSWLSSWLAALLAGWLAGVSTTKRAICILPIEAHNPTGFENANVTSLSSTACTTAALQFWHCRTGTTNASKLSRQFTPRWHARRSGGVRVRSQQSVHCRCEARPERPACCRMRFIFASATQRSVRRRCVARRLARIGPLVDNNDAFKKTGAALQPRGVRRCGLLRNATHRLPH